MYFFNPLNTWITVLDTWITLPATEDFAEVAKKYESRYPLFAFILYSEVDKDIIEFINSHNNWLHELSHDNCLIFVLENPQSFGERWLNFWKKRLGVNFEPTFQRWNKLKPEDRNKAFQIANSFNVQLNTLPCIVFWEKFSSKKVVSIPLSVPKEKYKDYFMDIFEKVRKAVQEPEGYRLETLDYYWRQGWNKWILPEHIKNTAKGIQEWGTIISTTEDIVLKVIAPFIPFLKSLFKENQELHSSSKT